MKPGWQHLTASDYFSSEALHIEHPPGLQEPLALSASPVNGWCIIGAPTVRTLTTPMIELTFSPEVDQAELTVFRFVEKLLHAAIPHMDSVFFLPREHLTIHTILSKYNVESEQAVYDVEMATYREFPGQGTEYFLSFTPIHDPREELTRQGYRKYRLHGQKRA